MKGFPLLRARSLTLAAALVAPACQARTPSAPPVRFEVRGLQTQATEGQYGTTFYNKATIVALGDSAVTTRPYFVILSVNKVSGGNPETPNSYPMEFIEPVVRGVGDLSVYGGYRSKTESWEPEKIEVSIVGFAPAFPVASNTARTP